MKLILKRKKLDRQQSDGQTAIKISNENYNKVCEVAEETGLSLKKALDKLVEFAYENVEYEDGDNK